MKASDRQVGGSHYHECGIQPWEVMERRYGKTGLQLYIEMDIVKRIIRSKGSRRVEMEKIQHEIQKWLELEEAIDKRVQEEYSNELYTD